MPWWIQEVGPSGPKSRLGHRAPSPQCSAEQCLPCVHMGSLLYDYSHSSTELGYWFPNCSSESRDISANAGLLLISGLQPEDKTDYHCVLSHGSGNIDC